MRHRRNDPIQPKDLIAVVRPERFDPGQVETVKIGDIFKVEWVTEGIRQPNDYYQFGVRVVKTDLYYTGAFMVLYAYPDAFIKIVSDRKT